MQTSTIPSSIKSSSSNSNYLTVCANFDAANDPSTTNNDASIWKTVVTQYNKDPTSVYFIDKDENTTGFNNLANIFNTINFPTFPAYVILSSSYSFGSFGGRCKYTIIQFNNPSSSSSSWSSTPIPSSSPPPIGKILQDFRHDSYTYILTSTGVEINYNRVAFNPIPSSSSSGSGLGLGAIVGILVGIVLGLFGFYKFYKWWKNRQEAMKKTTPSSTSSSTSSSTPAKTSSSTQVKTSTQA